MYRVAYECVTLGRVRMIIRDSAKAAQRMKDLQDSIAVAVLGQGLSVRLKRLGAEVPFNGAGQSNPTNTSQATRTHWAFHPMKCTFHGNLSKRAHPVRRDFNQFLINAKDVSDEAADCASSDERDRGVSLTPNKGFSHFHSND